MSGSILSQFKAFFSKFTDKKPPPPKGSSYIVTFKRDTPDEVIDQEVEKAKASGVKVNHVYKAAIKGYSVTVPDDLVSSFSVDHENLERVEADGEVTTQGKALLTQA